MPRKAVESMIRGPPKKAIAGFVEYLSVGYCIKSAKQKKEAGKRV